MNKYKSQSGFTLLELMVTVAIIGIISMFAIPSYMDSVRKSKISKITQDMVSLAGDIEAIRMQGNAYDSTKVSDHVTDKKDVKYSKNVIGGIAISGATKSSYTLTATAQDFDAGDCGAMTINNLGERTPVACWKQ